MTPAGIEPAIFRFVTQHLNYCATAFPRNNNNNNNNIGSVRNDDDDDNNNNNNNNWLRTYV